MRLPARSGYERMTLVGIDHVQLAIPAGGLEEERRFFCDMFDMQEVPRPSNMTFEGCWLEAPGVSLHIGMDPNFVPATKAHPAFLVDDLEALRERLDQAGVVTKDGSPVPGFGRFFTQDPFGNRIELVEKL